MPEMIPVGNTGTPPNAQQSMGMLSGIIGLQQQKQQLQTGQYLQQTAAAQAQQQQLAAGQQQGVQDFFSIWDPSQHIGDDGTTNIESALKSDEYQRAGNAKPGIMQALLDIKQKQLTNKQSLSTLDAGLLTQLGSQVGAAANDPDVIADKTDSGTGVNAGRAKVQKIFENFSKLSPEAARVAQIYGPMTEHAPASKLVDGVKALRDQALSVSEQLPKQMAVARGSTTDIYNVGPEGLNNNQQPAASVGMGIPPGWDVYQDPITKNPYMINRQTGESRPMGVPFSKPLGPSGPPGASGPSVSGLNPPQSGNVPPQRAPGQGEVEAAGPPTNWANHQANITAAREANTQLDQIRQARSILQSGISTARGAESLAGTEQLLSQLPGLGGLAGEGSKTEKLDVLNKFLERIGAQSASLMGSTTKTDAAAESLKAQIGSIGYGNAALDKVLKYTASQYAAAQGKDRGEQQFFATKGNSIVNQDQYEQKWRSNYDPRIYQIASESPQEAARQVAEMKKNNPKDYVTFLKKYAAIRDMGAAPQ